MTNLTILAYVKEIDEEGNVVEDYTIAAEPPKQDEKEEHGND